MSDTLTAYMDKSSNGSIVNDNLVAFLHQLAQFGIDQCLHLIRLIASKQRLLHSASTLDDQHMHFNRLLTETQTLQNAFHQILSAVSLSDDQDRQLSFVQLQNYLSAFVEINLRFKSLTASSQELPLDANSKTPADSIRPLLSTSSASSVPQRAVSSSFCSNDELDGNSIDIGKSWKFANIIRTRFHMSLIASNSQVILCYNNENHFLHFVLVAGHYQEGIKWSYDPIVDVLWCAPIDRYLALTRHAIYTIQYHRSSRTSPVNINKVLDVGAFHATRMTCNDRNVLLYVTEQRTSAIHIYDYQFNREKTFDSATNEQLPINSPSFCCTNTLIALTEKDNVLISCFPYITPKKTSLHLFDVHTLELRYSVDLNDCLNIYTMKSLAQPNVFFALSDEKILWIITIDQNEAIQIAKKTFYTNQTEMCVINDRDLLLINVNGGCAIQMIKYRKTKQ